MSKTILVTGASSGIGYETVQVLLKNGFRVVAVVRQDADRQRLLEEHKKKSPDSVAALHVLQLDLADFLQIEKIPQILKLDCQIEQLDGLVNNAGIALAGPFYDQPFSEVQSIIHLNVLSLMKVTQVLLPLLKNELSAGRIVNISSISGISAAPFLSVYAASKHAIEGFSVGLRKELMLLGIKVIVIGPGSVRTPIWKKGFQAIQNHYSQSLYALPFQKFIRMAAEEEEKSLPVEVVAELILHALVTARPCYRYAPIPRKWLNWYLPKLIPNQLYDYLTAKALGLMG